MRPRKLFLLFLWSHSSFLRYINGIQLTKFGLLIHRTSSIYLKVRFKACVIHLYLRSEDTKWDHCGFQKLFVCVLVLMSYIDNSNKKMGSPSLFFRNFELKFRILSHFLYRDIVENVVFSVQLSQSTLGALEL
jgi:hypothetical protein